MVSCSAMFGVTNELTVLYRGGGHFFGFEKYYADVTSLVARKILSFIAVYFKHCCWMRVACGAGNTARKKQLTQL